MVKSNQIRSHADCIKDINPAQTQIINGVKLTIGYNPDKYFNLSILANQHPYQADANGYYDYTKPLLHPLEWIKSVAGQKHITKLYKDTERLIFASHYQSTDKYPATIYTRSFYLWIGYLKYCIGNIDNAICAELSN